MSHPQDPALRTGAHPAAPADSSPSLLVPMLLAGLALVLAGTAAAHPIHGTGHHLGTWNSLLSGFLHPLTGIDHLLAMLAVGLWAGQLGRPATWLLPVLFPVVMAAGALAAMGGLGLPGIEPAIVASVVALGVAVMLHIRVPLAAAGVLVASFGLVHGYAHGAEIPAMAGPAFYTAGFLLATVLLHLGGVLLGSLSREGRTTWLVRAGGSAIALSGVALALV